MPPLFRGWAFDIPVLSKKVPLLLPDGHHFAWSGFKIIWFKTVITYMKCTWNVLSSCIENSGAMTLKGSTCTCKAQIALRSSTFEDPASRFPIQVTENSKFYFKVRQLTKSSNSTLPHTHRAAGGVKRGGGEGCFDWSFFGRHIFNQRAPK